MPTAPISCCAARLLQGNIAVLAAAVAAAVVVFTKVRRFMRGIVLPSRRNGTLPPKKKAAPPEGAPLSFWGVGLKLEPQAKLHPSRCMRPIQHEERITAQRRINRIELRVIEEIEVFPPEVQRLGLSEGESLEEPEVEIQPARHI